MPAIGRRREPDASKKHTFHPLAVHYKTVRPMTGGDNGADNVQWSEED
jgi:hypothetical protein